MVWATRSTAVSVRGPPRVRARHAAWWLDVEDPVRRFVSDDADRGRLYDSNDRILVVAARSTEPLSESTPRSRHEAQAAGFGPCPHRNR
jgi:hypothetical protein